MRQVAPELVAELGASRALVLVQDKMTTPAKKAQRATHSATPLEVFRYAELFFDKFKAPSDSFSLKIVTK